MEFFVSPAKLDMLVERISRNQNITYYAINKHGDLRTNNSSEGPNAVTWGVFPGKEIIQPTIVEAVSFMAWKVWTLCRQNGKVCLTNNDFLRTRPSNWADSGPGFTSPDLRLTNSLVA